MPFQALADMGKEKVAAGVEHARVIKKYVTKVLRAKSEDYL